LCQNRRLHVHPQETAPMPQPLYLLPSHPSLRLPVRAKRVAPGVITLQEQCVDKGVGPAPLHHGYLVGGDIEAAVHLYLIGVDDLPGEHGGQVYKQFRLPRAGGPH
ncbi:unnamed protein product, partial [Musa acuminata subsp. malaccensis]